MSDDKTYSVKWALAKLVDDGLKINKSPDPTPDGGDPIRSEAWSLNQIVKHGIRIQDGGLDPDPTVQGSVEVWVSPDGDDSNPGTRSAPFRTIQYGLDAAFEKAGHLVTKVVNVFPGQYPESLIVNARNLVLRAVKPNTINEYFTGVTGDGVNPTLLVTNMSKEGVAGYLADGGASYAHDPVASSFTYTGASVIREITGGSPFEWSDDGAGFAFEGMSFRSASGIMSVAVIAGSDSTVGSKDIYFHPIVFDGCGASRDFYIKNASAAIILAINCSGNLVLDNSCTPSFMDDATGLQMSDRMQLSNTTLIVRNNKDVDYTIEGTPFNKNWLFPVYRGVNNLFKNVYWYGDVMPNSWDTANTNNITIRSRTDMEFLNKVRVGGEFLALDVGGTFRIRGESVSALKSLLCKNFEKPSTGNLAIRNLHVTENVTISAGTENIIKSGTIEGNLTVSGGANIDLTGVIVKGNVDFTGAGTVTWKGGHFEGTLTDPDSKLGGATAGSYLYIA